MADGPHLHSVEIHDDAASSHFGVDDQASVHDMRDDLVNNPRQDGWKPTLDLNGRHRSLLLTCAFITIFVVALDAATWSNFLLDYQSNDSTFMFFLAYTSSLPGWAYTYRLVGPKAQWALAWTVFWCGYLIEVVVWFVTTDDNIMQWLEANVACRLLEGIGGAGMVVAVLLLAPELYPPENRYSFQAIIWAAFAGLSMTGMAYYVDFIRYWIGYHIPQLLGLVLGPLCLYFLHISLPTPYWSTLKSTLVETYDYVGSFLFWFASAALLIPAYILPAMFLGHYLILGVTLYAAAVVMAVVFIIWERRRWKQEVGGDFWGEEGERNEKEERVFLPFYLWRNWNLWVVGITEMLVGMATFGAVKYVTRLVAITEIATQSASDGSMGMFLAYILLNFGLLISSLVISFIYPCHAVAFPPRYSFWLGVVCITIATVMCTFGMSLWNAWLGAAPMGYCFLFGVGVGAVLQAGMVIGQAQVEVKDYPVVTALLSGFFFLLGGGIVSGIHTGIYYISYEHYLDEFGFLVFHNSTFPVTDPTNPVYNQTLSVVIDPDRLEANLWARMNATYLTLDINVVFGLLAIIPALFLKGGPMAKKMKNSNSGGQMQTEGADIVRGRRDEETQERDRR